MVRHSLCRCFLMALTLCCFSSATARAQVVEFNLDKMVMIEPNTRVTARVEFTRDGKVIDSAEREFLNGTNRRATNRFRRNAPEGTNDRHYFEEHSRLGRGLPVMAGSELPSWLVPDFAMWLLDNGFFIGYAAFQTPMAIADLNFSGEIDAEDESIFALIEDPDAFAPFANEGFFPLGSVLMTDAEGLLKGIPGLRFYVDPDFTIPYAEGPLLITGINSEAAYLRK